MAIATVMGAPLEDAPRLHHWSDWIQRQFDATALMEQRPQIEEAVQEFYDWAAELLERRATTPVRTSSRRSSPLATRATASTTTS